MNIAHVKISNILGITELEFTPEGFTEITGQNGQGKTSVLEAIKAAIVGGHDATLLRKGQEKGEIVLILDDGTELKKKVTEKASQTEIFRDGKKVARPTDVIKALTDMLSLNPVDFLRAPKKDRVKVLLETMPLEADVTKLTLMTGIPVKAEPGIHALHLIENVAKLVYDDRTGTNRAIKEKDATINQLRLALPDAPGGADGNEDELAAAVAAADTTKQAELDRVQTKLDGIRKDTQSKIDLLREETQAKIDAIKTEASEAVAALQKGLTDFEGKAAIQREKTIALHTAAVTPLNTALNAFKLNRTNAAKRSQALDTIKTLEAELAELQTDCAGQNKALADIEAYKSELLSSLPIPGLEVKDGDIFRDGIHFDRLNTAQQVDVAVEIAKLRAGDLGVCCVDGIELLDAASFEAFRDRALESGLQLFVSRVSDEQFAVKTHARND
jgi:hypothetical protein